MRRYLLLCKTTRYEVVVDDIHITHPRHVGGETPDNLERGGVKDVHLTSDITTAEILLREFEQANSCISGSLQRNRNIGYVQILDTFGKPPISLTLGACARGTLVVLCVCVCVCLSVCLLPH